MSDFEIIQGTWQVIGGEKAGLTIPIDPERFGSKLLYDIRPKKTPKEIDLRHRDPGARSRSSGKGIYALDRDTLTICWVYEGERPQAFPSSDEPDKNLLVLKRVDSTD